MRRRSPHRARRVMVRTGPRMRGRGLKNARVTRGCDSGLKRTSARGRACVPRSCVLPAAPRPPPYRHRHRHCTAREGAAACNTGTRPRYSRYPKVPRLTTPHAHDPNTMILFTRAYNVSKSNRQLEESLLKRLFVVTRDK